MLCRSTIAAVSAAFIVIYFLAMLTPLMADAADSTNVAPAGVEDFGQYLVDHQADLAPFFAKNSEDLFKIGIPLMMGLSGWVILITMAAGWAIDILLSRAFSFVFAPASADWKRSVIYATGRLFLSFLYTCLMGLAIVFSLKLVNAGMIMTSALLLLLLVAMAAQIVWILYLFRTDFPISAAFYLVIIVVHAAIGFVIARPIMGVHASGAVTNFVDQAITPRLQAEVSSTKNELAGVEATCNAEKAQATDLQSQLSQAQSDEDQLRREIEAKKNSDIYVFAHIALERARGNLTAAHDQLGAFLAKFPSSSLNVQARAQLLEVQDQLAAQETQERQKEADAARAAAQARADLLARAGKGEATLSEMRQALIGKTRDEVSSLLGLPSDTASDSWGYRRQMILNPMTNERSGLTVNFAEGLVQGVDYDRNGGSQ